MRLLLLSGFLLLARESFSNDTKPIPVAVPKRSAPVSYAKEVADVFAAKCVGCHSEALAENKLNLEDVAGMLKGGKSGPALVPGKADDSLLFKMAAHRVEPVMPPAKKKDAAPLSGSELGLIKLWIDAGAKDDSAEASEAPTPIRLGELPPGIHSIGAVDLTADGARVACGRANLVQVYDSESGLEIISLGGHKDIVQSLRFSPNGRFLAAGGFEVVTLWNAPTGGLKATFAGHTDQVTAVTSGFEPGVIASAGLDKTVRIWDDKGKLLHTYPVPAPVLSLAATVELARVAVGGADHVIRYLDIAGGETAKELAALKGHSGPVNALVIYRSGDDRYHLVSASTDGTVRVWTLPEKSGETTDEPKVLDGMKGPVRALAVSAYGELIAAAGDSGKVHLWRTADLKPLRTIDAHDAPVLALAFDPGRDDLILTGSADKTARLFESTTGALRATFRAHPGPVNSVAFNLDGRQVITAGEEGGLKVWDAATGQGVIAFGHSAPGGKPIRPVKRVHMTVLGQIVSASADSTLKSWAYEGIWSERRPLGPHAFRVLALDFNPDGTLLAAGGGEPSRSGEIKVWEVGKGMPVRTLHGLHSDTVFGLRFSPDGLKLASAAADKFMKVSRVADGKELRSFEGHSHHVMAVDWKSDGKQLVTGGADNVLKVWDAESGEQVKTLQAAGKQVTSVRWVPGKSQVAGASGDKLVRFWNPEGGILRTFNGPGDYVFGVATSSDGSRVAAGGADGVLFVWDGKDGRVVRKIEPAAEATKAGTPGRP